MKLSLLLKIGQMTVSKYYRIRKEIVKPNFSAKITWLSGDEICGECHESISVGDLVFGFVEYESLTLSHAICFEVE